MNSSVNTVDTPTAPLSDRVNAELINRLSTFLVDSVLLTMILPIAMVAFFWAHVNHVYLLLWALADIVFIVDRYWISRRYQQLKPPADQSQRWSRRFSLSGAGSGLTWGVGGMLFFVEGSMPHQVLLLVIVMGIAAGSICIYAMSYVPQMLLAYAVPVIGMTAARVAMEGSMPYLAMSAIMLFYLVMIVRTVKDGHVFIVDSINLSFENVDLIEQLKEQKDIAERANVAKSKFLAAASHDLRQPLHALGLFASALNERIKYPDVRGLVENINQSVAALEGLFNALLDISRLDAGVILPKVQHFRIGALMERLSSEFTSQAQRKGLSMQFEGADTAVHSDPALLETVLRNLISNAIRFTTSGNVKVAWKEHESRVLIEVRDTGIGIPAEETEAVFQEFAQLNNPERDRTKGLGLGLAIVRRLAGLLSFTVTLQSKVGDGSLFRLSLPLGDIEQVTDDQSTVIEQLEHEPTMRVLVLDDEASVREAMTTLLGEWGHVVVAVGSLTEATQVMQQPPDVIIADYRLREKHTGIEAIQHLHQLWGANIPSLIVTGDTAPERLREAQASGIAFMHKPVNAAKLRAFLRSVSRHGNLAS